MNLKLPWYWLPCTWWPWHWIFKVEFLNGCISGTWCPIGKKRKWYELKQCWSHNLTLTFDLPMTIFQLLNLRKGLSVWHEMKGIWIDTWYFDISVTYPQGLGLFSKLVQAGSVTFLSASNWGYLLHVEHMSCVITNCVRHQWVIPSFFSMSLYALLEWGSNVIRKLWSSSLDLFFKILLHYSFSYILCFPIIFHTSVF